VICLSKRIADILSDSGQSTLRLAEENRFEEFALTR
jgi:hypothetical protein